MLAEPNTAVIDCGGVGYKLTISSTTFSQLPPLNRDNPPKVKLFTHLAVREDAVELYGFHSSEEHSSFKMLISVSGVGPKAAMSILSIMTPEKFALAVISEDSKALAKAPGVGAKTAARIVLELRDKLAKEFSDSSSVSGKSKIETVQIQSKGKISEAQDALLVLGYTRAEAMAALKDIDPSDELEVIIRKSLAKLIKQ